MNLETIRAEFARRAVMFHANTPVEKISLWGLFTWGTISKYIKSGEIILDEGFSKVNKVVWCRPSQNEIDNHIKPMIKKYSVQELIQKAGW